MPSTSAKQHRFMAAIAHSPSFAKKVGVSQSVGKDFDAADKGKTFKRGGDVKKFTEGGLSDSETRMVPYGKLSDKRKAEIKSQYEKDAKEAGANVKRPFGSKVLDAYYEMNPLVSEKQRQSVRSDATEDVAQRQRKLDYAEGRLKSLGTRKEYFSDDAPHKIDPNEKLFNKGGMMKNRRFDEGGETSAYEIDPDSRRAHGLYDEKPVVKKLKRAFKKTPFRGGQEGYDEAGRFLGGQRGFNEAGTANKSGTKQTQYSKGGMMKESKAMVGKEMAFMKKKGAPKSMIKHEKAEMMGMKKGGMPMKDGKPAFMAKFAKGGGIESRGKTKGTMIRMATGGSVSSASRRADGIAQRGKTKC